MRKPLIVITGIGLVLLSVFGPILFGGRLFSGLYVNLYHVYFFDGQQFLINTLGQWPGWWPAFSSGYPISLTLDGFLNPIFLLTLKFFPVLPSYHWLTLGFFLANLAAMYAFGRTLRLSKSAALIAAMSYGFSGIVIRWTDVIVFTAVMPLIPLSFLAITRIHAGMRGWRWIYAAMLAYGWVAGFAELLVYILLANAGYALYLMIVESAYPDVRSFLIDGVKKYLAPVLASVVIVLPWLVSVLYFILEHTIRSGGLATADASSMPLTLSYFVRLFLPRLSVFYGGSIPVLRLEDDIDLFIGMAPLFLLAVLPFVWKSLDKKARIFFPGLLAFAVLMSFRSPLYLLLHPLPVLSWFRWHFKWSFLTVFAAAILAGYALDAIKTFVEHRRAKAFIIAAWSLLGVVVAGLAGMTAFGANVRTRMIDAALSRYEQSSAAIGRELPRSAEYYRWLIEQMADSFVKGFSFLDPWTTFSVCLWLAVLAVVTLAATGRLSHKKLRDGLLLTTLAGSLVWTGFLVGEPVAYLTETPATARYLHEQNRYRTVPVTAEQQETHVPYRIFTFFPDQTIADLQDRFRIELVNHQNRAWLSRELLDDNINTWFRVDGMFNHEPLTESRITLLFTRATHGDTTRTDATLPENIARFSSTGTARELGAQNVKYVLSPHELAEPWKRVFETRAVNDRVPVYVYENPFFLPRWYLADAVEWTQDPSTEGLGVALDRASKTERTTLLETRSPSDAALQTRADPDDTLSLIRYTAGAVTLTTNTAYPRWVVFSETGVSYWRAFVDGTAVPIYRANAAYQAVLVPAGTHEVSFEYPEFWKRMHQALTRLLGTRER
jgi:hypothetical protein